MDSIETIFEWGPEGSLTRYLADKNKNLIKSMIKTGWKPQDPLESQREWWATEKRNKDDKAWILILKAHLTLAGRVHKYVQDKQEKAEQKKHAAVMAINPVLPALTDFSREAPYEECPDWECLIDETSPRCPTGGSPPVTTDPPNAKAAPLKIECIPGGQGRDGRGRQAQIKMTYVSLSPGDTMKLLEKLPTLQPRHSNAIFWQKMKEMQLCHNLHNRDIAGLVRAKMPENHWARLRAEHQNGTWCADLDGSRREQEQALTGFKNDIILTMGEVPVSWSVIVGVTQKKEEGAQEYGRRKFDAFVAHGGMPDADRQNPAFLQLYRDGLSPAHQAILKTGLVNFNTFDELENWAVTVDNQQRKTQGARAGISAVGTEGGHCYRCGELGHFKRECQAIIPHPPNTCNKCGRIGHTESTCKDRRIPRRKGAPPKRLEKTPASAPGIRENEVVSDPAHLSHQQLLDIIQTLAAQKSA